MRICLRCKSPMVENLEIRPSDANGLCVSQKGLFGATLGKVSCAVCPDCGYVETYVDKTEKIKKLQNNN